MTDSIEKARSEMGGVESFFSKLPGVAGYREKEMRRTRTSSCATRWREAGVRRRKITALQNDLLAAAACCGWMTWSGWWAACNC